MNRSYPFFFASNPQGNSVSRLTDLIAQAKARWLTSVSFSGLWWSASWMSYGVAAWCADWRGVELCQVWRGLIPSVLLSTYRPVMERLQGSESLFFNSPESGLNDVLPLS
jgi:hypothetical protein